MYIILLVEKKSDLFLTCEENLETTYQIWVNTKDKGFVLTRYGSFPQGTGPITFADIGL